MSISASLQKAAKLQEKIEELRDQLVVILEAAHKELARTPVPALSGTPPRVSKVAAQTPKVATIVKPAPTPNKGVKAAVTTKPAAKSQKPTATKKPAASPLAGRNRASSPSGPLAPAVVKVLAAAKGKPMRVAEILEGLFASGYAFSSPEPKKNLAARIYRLSGVKQVDEGLFTAV